MDGMAMPWNSVPRVGAAWSCAKKISTPRRTGEGEGQPPGRTPRIAQESFAALSLALPRSQILLLIKTQDALIIIRKPLHLSGKKSSLLSSLPLNLAPPPPSQNQKPNSTLRKLLETLASDQTICPDTYEHSPFFRDLGVLLLCGFLEFSRPFCYLVFLFQFLGDS